MMAQQLQLGFLEHTGNVTMTLAANQITSTQLTGAVSLQILSSDGTVVKTLFGEIIKW